MGVVVIVRAVVVVMIVVFISGNAALVDKIIGCGCVCTVSVVAAGIAEAVVVNASVYAVVGD